MRLKIVAIRDRALDAFHRPFFVPSIGMAIRSFSDEVNRPDSEMAKHPDDYDLFVLGEFDEDSGEFACGKPVQIAIGKNVVMKRV